MSISGAPVIPARVDHPGRGADQPRHANPFEVGTERSPVEIDRARPGRGRSRAAAYASPALAAIARGRRVMRGNPVLRVAPALHRGAGAKQLHLHARGLNLLEAIVVVIDRVEPGRQHAVPGKRERIFPKRCLNHESRTAFQSISAIARNCRPLANLQRLALPGPCRARHRSLARFLANVGYVTTPSRSQCLHLVLVPRRHPGCSAGAPRSQVEASVSRSRLARRSALTPHRALPRQPGRGIRGRRPRALREGEPGHASDPSQRNWCHQLLRRQLGQRVCRRHQRVRLGRAEFSRYRHRRPGPLRRGRQQPGRCAFLPASAPGHYFEVGDRLAGTTRPRRVDGDNWAYARID